VLVVILGMRVGRLEDRVGQLQERASTAYPGLVVPSFTTTSIEGDTITIGETAGPKQVLFMFTTTCPYCLASIPAWRDIATLADTSTSLSFTAFAVSLDSIPATADYARSNTLTQVVTFPGRRWAGLYRIRSVPHILVLSSEGRVLYSRTGVFTNQAALDSLRVVLATLDG
jgi:hypothetical protein